MMVYFPEPYPDELFYSWICRYWVHSGFPTYNMVLEELTKDKTARIDMEFGMTSLNSETRQYIQREYSLEKIILEHTMFKIYARFVSLEKRKEAMGILLSGDGDIRRVLQFPINKNGVRHLRYCPMCSQEDRKKYGETYWHRTHQIRGINTCYEHGCYLIDTEAEMSAKNSPRLWVCDVLVENEADQETISATDIEKGLAEYVSRLFQTCLSEQQPNIGEWLVTKLEGTPYITARGQRKYIGKLFTDFVAFFNDLNVTVITQPHQLQKIFTGYITDFTAICQLGYFLKIPTNEFEDMIMPEKTQTERFDEKVKRLHSEGLGCYRIARAVGSSPSTALHANREKKKMVHNYSVRKGMRSNDWEQMDNEMLPIVKNVCVQIYQGRGGKPRRVTAFAITKAMGWPDKRLTYLPKCRELVLDYWEVQESYWAREIVWAYLKLTDGLGESQVNWRQLRDITNMRRNDFERCKPYLKCHTDKRTETIISEII